MTLTVDFSLNPRIITVAAPDTDITVQAVVNDVRDIEDELVNLSYPRLISAAGKEELGGGVTVGITVTLQNARIKFEDRFTPVSTGTCKTASTGAKLIDAAATFIADGVAFGAIVENVDDGSLSTVVTIDSETQLTTTQLTNGTENDWDVGEEYKIWNIIQCNLFGGNLVSIDEVGAELDPVAPSAFTQVIRTSSASATLQELSAIQYSSFGSGVTIDVINGVPGTSYPIGTIEQPVDNLQDAVMIANSRGFITLYVNESMTFDTGTDIQDFNIVGRSRIKTVITIDTTALCDGISVRNCTVAGVLDGNVQIDNCNIGDLLYVYGQVSNSALYGTITLAGDADAYLADCSTLNPNSIPAVDMGGSGQNIFLADWSGGIKFRNMTGDQKIGVQMDGGRVMLEPTISAGFVGLTGTGELYDSSTGTVNISTSGLMSKATIGEAVYDQIGTEIQYASFGGVVAIDVVDGIAGTDYDIGTITNPVNNLTDAKAICATRGFETIHIHGDLTIPAGENVDGYTFEADGWQKTIITVDPAASTQDCIFNYCGLTGTLSGNNKLYDCRIENLSNLNGEAILCRLTGTMTLGGGANTTFMRCGTAVLGSPTIINMGGSGQGAMFHDWSGGLKFTNLSADHDIRVQIDGGQIKLDPTISAGYVQLVGIAILVDNSTGTCVVNANGLMSNEAIAVDIWGADVSTYTATGTFGKLVKSIKSGVDAVIGILS